MLVFENAIAHGVYDTSQGVKLRRQAGFDAGPGW
jgi:hypothetical protein